MTTESDALPKPAKPETPWMVDGGGLPPNPMDLIRQLVSEYMVNSAGIISVECCLLTSLRVEHLKVVPTGLIW